MTTHLVPPKNLNFGYDLVKTTIDSTFFTNCAFVCVDLQDGGPQTPITEDGLHEEWRAMGFTVDDVNNGFDYAWGVALPNAARVAQDCLAMRIPRIFVHWGFRFADGMDLDPVVRAKMIRQHGNDYAKWPGRLGHPGARPSAFFNVQPNDYVIPKTSQDAFASSTLHFVLANLGIRNVIFAGGHTEACLNKTAVTAKRIGYRTLCVEDATSNARESSRFHGILASEFDYVVSSDTLLQATAAVRAAKETR
jgi:nicotinamidase-related amidase